MLSSLLLLFVQHFVYGPDQKQQNNHQHSLYKPTTSELITRIHSYTQQVNLLISNINEYQVSKEEKIAEIMANVASKIEDNQNNVLKNNVKKIQDKLQDKLKPHNSDNPKNIIPNEVKEIITNIDFKNIDSNLNSPRNIINNIIKNRNDELNNLSNNSIVKKFINKLKTKTNIKNDN